MSEAEHDWLEPTRTFQFVNVPKPTPGFSYPLLIACWHYRMVINTVRWHLAHPDDPVPGYVQAVVQPHGGERNRSKRAREQRALYAARMTREHVRRIVFVFWPRLATLADLVCVLATEEQPDANADEPRVLLESDPHPPAGV